MRKRGPGHSSKPPIDSAAFKSAFEKTAAGPAPVTGAPKPAPGPKKGPHDGLAMDEEAQARRTAKAINSGKLGPLPKQVKKDLWAAWQDLMLSIGDRDGYIVVKGQGQGRMEQGKLTAKQIHRIVMKLIFEQGCDQIWFYKGNKIDEDATKKARAIVAAKINPLLAAYGRQIEIKDSLYKEARLPWVFPISYHALIGQRLAEWSERRANQKATNASIKEMKSFFRGHTAITPPAFA